MKDEKIPLWMGVIPDFLEGPSAFSPNVTRFLDHPLTSDILIVA
jgi:hypothetical protein